MPPAPDLGPARLAAAHRCIAPYIRRTPVLEAAGGDFGLDPSVRLVFKLELCQHSGSFKPRGAFANLLLRTIPPVGVAAASGGNHGAAVAYAARRLNIPATIFVPTVASPAKLRQIRSYGAELVVEGERYADALEASERWIADSGALPVHAFDQVETLLGASSVAREIDEDAPGLDSLFVAVGGGGLLGGTAAWHGAKAERTCALVGVEPEAGPHAHPRARGGTPGGCRGGRHRGGLARPAPGGRADVPSRAAACRPRRSRQRRRDSSRAGGALARAPTRGRARRGRRLRGAAVGGVPAARGRAGRRGHLRWQHHRRGFRGQREALRGLGSSLGHTVGDQSGSSSSGRLSTPPPFPAAGSTSPPKAIAPPCATRTVRSPNGRFKSGATFHQKRVGTGA